MGENSKYPSLTEEDKGILDKCVIAYLVGYYSLISKYPDAKEFAMNEGTKFANSESDILRVLSHGIIRDTDSSHPIRPAELKESLSNKLQSYSFPNEVSEYMLKISENLDSRGLNEKVLQKLKEEGVLHNFQGNNFYKKVYPSHPGRKSESSIEDHGGKRSIYFAHEDIEKLKTIFNHPESIDYVHHKLLNSGLLDKISKYMVSFIFYLVRFQGDKVLNSLLPSLDLGKIEYSQNHIYSLQKDIPSIKNLTDEQIELISENGASYLSKNKEFFFKLLPLFGLVKL